MDNSIKGQRGFQKGHHIGRPKGSGNKKLNIVREKFQQLLDGYPVQQMQADLMEMEPGERLRLIVAMGDFFLPKLNRVDNTFNTENDTIIVLPVVAESLTPIVEQLGESDIPPPPVAPPQEEDIHCEEIITDDDN